MKLYQIIMKVPDDFIPEDMELVASCKDAIEICSEGFIGPRTFIEPEEEVVVEAVEGDLEQEDRAVKESFDVDSYYGEVADFDTEDTPEPVVKEEEMQFEPEGDAESKPDETEGEPDEVEVDPNADEDPSDDLEDSTEEDADEEVQYD